MGYGVLPRCNEVGLKQVDHSLVNAAILPLHIVSLHDHVRISLMIMRHVHKRLLTVFHTESRFLRWQDMGHDTLVVRK